MEIKSRLYSLFRNYWGLLVSITTTFYFLLPRMNDVFVMDETAFPEAANGVARHGVPDFYNGITRPRDLAIWHPPLYVYTLGIWIKVLGNSNYSVRIFGVLCMFMTGIIIFSIVRILKANETNKLPENIAIMFYFSHYSILQLSQVNDIDGTVLPIFITLALLIFIRTSKNLEKSDTAAVVSLGFGLGMAISSKLTTSLLLIPLIFVVFRMRGKKRLWSAAYAILTSFLGMIFFLVWWYPIAKISNLDWKFPFTFTIQSFNSKNQSDSFWELLTGFFTFPISVTLWLGLPTLALSFFAIIYLITLKKFPNSWDGVILLFGFFSWGVFNAIGAVGFTFPRYWNIGLISLSIFLGVLSSRFSHSSVFNLPIRHWHLLFGTLAICLIIFKFEFQNKENILRDMVDLSNIQFLSICSIIMLILYFIFMPNRIDFRKAHLSNFIFFFIICLAICNNYRANELIKNSDYSVRYFFGERGLQETVDWISKNVKAQDSIVAAKDVGLGSGADFYEDAILYYSYSPLILKKFLLDNEVDYIVVRNKYDYSRLVFGPTINMITTGFKKIEGQFYDFEIWKRISS